MLIPWDWSPLPLLEPTLPLHLPFSLRKFNPSLPRAGWTNNTHKPSLTPQQGQEEKKWNCSRRTLNQSPGTASRQQDFFPARREGKNALVVPPGVKPGTQSGLAESPRSPFRGRGTRELSALPCAGMAWREQGAWEHRAQRAGRTGERQRKTRLRETL